MNGLAVQRASGSIHASHFELNCNGTEGSADLLLDASCNGLAVVGTEHYTVQGPQYGVRAKAVGNTIVGVVMSTGNEIAAAGDAFEAIVFLDHASSTTVIAPTLKPSAPAPAQPQHVLVKSNGPAITAEQGHVDGQAHHSNTVLAAGMLSSPGSFSRVRYNLSLPSALDRDTNALRIAADIESTPHGHDIGTGDNVRLHALAPSGGAGQALLEHNLVALRRSNHSVALAAHGGGEALDLTALASSVTQLQLEVLSFGGLFDLAWSGLASVWVQVPRHIADARYTAVEPVAEVTPANAAAARASGSGHVPYLCDVAHDGGAGTALKLCTASGAAMPAGTRWNARLSLRY